MYGPRKTKLNWLQKDSEEPVDWNFLAWASRTPKPLVVALSLNFETPSGLATDLSNRRQANDCPRISSYISVFKVSVIDTDTDSRVPSGVQRAAQLTTRICSVGVGDDVGAALLAVTRAGF